VRWRIALRVLSRLRGGIYVYHEDMWTVETEEAVLPEQHAFIHVDVAVARELDRYAEAEA